MRKVYFLLLNLFNKEMGKVLSNIERIQGKRGSLGLGSMKLSEKGIYFQNSNKFLDLE